MSRNPRLNDWPDCLTRLSVEQLKRELVHWQNKVRFLGHPNARKEAAKRMKDVQRELASRDVPAEK